MDSKRNTLERRSKILQMLNTDGKVSVKDLSNRFGVSEVSIRNDLVKLEEKGLLVRTRGGAIREKSNYKNTGLSDRLKQNFKEKMRIGKRAIDLIKEGDNVILSAGSTVIPLAKQLSRLKNIRVITHSLPVIDELSHNSQMEVIQVGGVLRSKMRSLVGPIAEKTLGKLSCNTVFLSVEGIDLESGIFSPVIEEASLSKIAIGVSEKVVVLADSSKFQRKSFAKVCSMDRIDVIITDKGIPDRTRNSLEKMGIEVIIA